MKKYPVYDVLVSNRERAVRLGLPLAAARQLKKKLKKQGKDAFIMKIWKGNLTGFVDETEVR